MKDIIFGIIAMTLILGYHVREYNIQVDEQGMTYSTSEADYRWPRTPLDRPMTKLEGHRLLAEGRELEIR